MGIEKFGIKLTERVARYVRACGKQSIIEIKPVRNIDTSQLGVCLSDGTIHFPKLNMTRFRTAEEAEARAKSVVMEQFKAPVEQQRELMTATVGKDLYIGNEGGTNFLGHFCVTPGGAIGKNAKLFHNHPVCTVNNGSNSLSVGDIEELLDKKGHSITAFNAQGEFCTATIQDKNKALKFFNDKELAMLKEMPENEREIRIFTRIRKLLWADLDDEMDKLKSVFGNNLTEEEILTRAQHISLKRMLSQFGIEYKTNFSNLLKYDA